MLVNPMRSILYINILLQKPQFKIKQVGCLLDMTFEVSFCLYEILRRFMFLMKIMT